MTLADEALAGLTPAGFWRRVFAGLCDGLLVLTASTAVLVEVIAAVALAQRYGWALPLSHAEYLPFVGALGVGWFLLTIIVLPTAYFVACEGAAGQTPGKRLFGIGVVGLDGQPIGYGRALARLLTLPYSLLPAGLGLLWAALPPWKCAWHDYISATRVVVISRSPGSGSPG
jgi:uncharacterized RDD family membrane protein YckC